MSLNQVLLKRLSKQEEMFVELVYSWTSKKSFLKININSQPYITLYLN